MNVDVADYDNDGWLDIYVTNITDEYMKECNMLWHNNHDGTFTDVSKETDTCSTLWGWAAKFGDFDNDGWPDLFVVDGLRSGGKENYIPVLVNLITRPGVDFTELSNWPHIGDMTWSGYQKKKLFRNLHGRHSGDVPPKPESTTIRMAAESRWAISTTMEDSICSKPMPINRRCFTAAYPRALAIGRSSGSLARNRTATPSVHEFALRRAE